MNFFALLSTILGSHHSPQHTFNPQANNMNPQQAVVPAGLQGNPMQLQSNVSGDESQMMPRTTGDYTPQFQVSPHAALNQALQMGMQHPLQGYFNQMQQLPMGANPQMGGNVDIQGPTNPGYIPLQNSGFGGQGYGANLQPGNQNPQQTTDYLNLFRR